MAEEVVGGQITGTRRRELGGRSVVLVMAGVGWRNGRRG
jgi:hypothetical protein